ncbi:MerR family transcriptional regulator [Pseudoflavonifractor sp. 60]|uniref:MerR family transcriptional regulator n=1 Tax=Pseudoflavonifractor sp. 60 TaxID=2304576 RepID=UPI00136B59ED|nr:MerR family transcriptional regulator [Pseudoflavonifractor sp. 60]NBI65450.1 MerR family transcriptional regulator [Pseudoflavonifractor sp. 60]
MEYTIQELSRLSGVTTRALRWYDKIGLLKPSRRAENGYRCYGPAEVDRLQDILYYRALGVELAQVKAFLDNPSYDRLAALRSHLTALEAELERVQGLIYAVKETIFTQERNEIMSDEKKFEAFKRHTVEENEKRYGSEIREQYGDAEVDAANAQIMGLTQEQYQEWERLGREILDKLAAAVAAGAAPQEEVGEEITALHRRWLTITGNAYDVQRHRGLAELYVQDQRFTAYYDQERPGCARFLRDAVLFWAK